MLDESPDGLPIVAHCTLLCDDIRVDADLRWERCFYCDIRSATGEEGEDEVVTYV